MSRMSLDQMKYEFFKIIKHFEVLVNPTVTLASFVTPPNVSVIENMYVHIYISVLKLKQPKNSIILQTNLRNFLYFRDKSLSPNVLDTEYYTYDGEINEVVEFLKDVPPNINDKNIELLYNRIKHLYDGIFLNTSDLKDRYPADQQFTKNFIDNLLDQGNKKFVTQPQRNTKPIRIGRFNETLNKHLIPSFDKLYGNGQFTTSLLYMLSPTGLNGSPVYVNLLDIQRPFKTYISICNDKILYKGLNITSNAKPTLRTNHMLHHFQICLVILQLLYLRIEIQTDKNKTAQPFVDNLSEREAFEEDDIVQVFAKFSNSNQEFNEFIKEQPRTMDNPKVFKFSKMAPDSDKGYQTYEYYYRHLDDAIGTTTKLDTFIEIISLLFDINYRSKEFFAHNMKTALQSININLATKQSNKCYFKFEDIQRLKDIYEKHCLLVINTLMMMNVESLSVKV